jgi:hypothetical protein
VLALTFSQTICKKLPEIAQISQIKKLPKNRLFPYIFRTLITFTSNNINFLNHLPPYIRIISHNREVGFFTLYRRQWQKNLMKKN